MTAHRTIEIDYQEAHDVVSLIRAADAEWGACNLRELALAAKLVRHFDIEGQNDLIEVYQRALLRESAPPPQPEPKKPANYNAIFRSKLTMEDEYPNQVRLSPHAINPINGPTNTKKFEHLCNAFAQVGWCGRPILVYEWSLHHKGLTGSHRVLAARIAGIKVPAVVIPASKEHETLFDELQVVTSDKTRLAVLQRYDLPEAISLMTLEVQENEKCWYAQ